MSRQLKRLGAEDEKFLSPWAGFIAVVDEAYHQFDEDRRMLERSLELSSLELLQANANMRALFQALPDLVLQVNSEGTILDVKQGHSPDLHHEHTGLLGETLRAFPTPLIGRQLFDCLQDMQHTQEMVVHEYVAPHADQEHWYEARFTPIDDQALLIIRNITERKHVESELQQAFQKLRDLQEHLIQSEKMAAMGTMAAGITHEINNPLMGVLLLVENQIASATVGTEIHTMLCRVETGLKRISDTVSKLLDFSRKEKLDFRHTCVNDLLEETLAMIEHEFALHGVELVKHLGNDLPPVNIAVNAMQQVLVNILLNAKDAVLESSTKRITVSTYVEQQMVRMKIRDEGLGIKSDDLQKIFDPFFTTKPAGKGTGMGMPIIKTIMDQHGGYVVVTSEEGRGTEVTLLLPLSDAPAEGEAHGTNTRY